MLETLKQLDVALFFTLNGGFRNSLFDVVMPWATNNMALMVLPFFILLLVRERKEALSALAIALSAFLLSDGLAHVLKDLVMRERPCTVLQNVNLLVGCSRSFSMPSNHASNAFAFALPFLLLTKGKTRFAFLFIALLVSLSRVFVGVHYPSDILAGALVGSLAAAVVIALYRWAEERKAVRPAWTVMVVVLLAFSLFRMYYIHYGPLDLSPDEAHYWEWSRRLDLSYYSKGPMIAYLIALSTAVFGDTVFGVRFPAVLFMAGSSLCLYRLGKEIYDEEVGAISALLLQIIPLYSTYGVIFTIDSPFLFFWLLSLCLFYKITVHQDSGIPIAGSGDSGTERPAAAKYWVLLGIVVGLGLLTKYTMAFFILSGFLFLIFSGRHRRLLISPGPYLALCLAIAVFSPVIIWNAQHDWVTIRHTAGQAHIADGFRVSAKYFFEFLGSQAGVLTPVFFFLIPFALWRVRNNDKGRFLLWFSVPILLFFTLKSLQGKVQANWAMTGYLPGIIGISEVYMRRWAGSQGSLKVLLISAVVIAVAVTSLGLYPARFGLPVKLDPSARLRGWDELGDTVGQIVNGAGGKGRTFIFSDSYQVSSELAFYVKGKPVTYCVNLGRRMNQYDLWPGFSDHIGRNGIFVTIGNQELPAPIKSAFRDHRKFFFAVEERGKILREYSLFICYDFQGIKMDRPRHF